MQRKNRLFASSMPDRRFFYESDGVNQKGSTL